MNVGKNPNAPASGSVRTVYLDSDGNISRKNLAVSVILMFFCIFSVCAGLILCVSQSFTLEIDLVNTYIALAVSLIFFTFIYFFASGIFTLISFLAVSGAAAFYIIKNLGYIRDAAYYTLNLCLYRINQAGYIIGSIVDYDLAETSDITTRGYLNTMAFFAVILFSAVFSFLVYSRRNIIYSLLFSVAVVFPGFFYGLIPGYFAFSLVASFWVSHFAVNIFDSDYMIYAAGRENFIPLKKMDRYKFKTFKKQYKRNIKSIKAEIVSIVKSPNRNENFIRLNRLVKQLEAIKKSNRLFFMFYGLNSLTDKNSKKNRDNKNNKDKKRKEKFLNPVQTEKIRIKTESREQKKAEKSGLAAEKKDFAGKSFSERFKIKYRESLNEKKKYTVRGGFAGFFAFVIAFIAVTAAQTFVADDARLDFTVPETVLNVMTSTVEYALVGSDSSVYGGYNGGMGGGFLYRPEGARFRDKPILKISPASESGNRSGVIYLKGWTGTVYTGNMWREADKKQIERYNSLGSEILIPGFNFISERFFFRNFTGSMQDIFGASYQRRLSELKSDRINIEHLVSGGKRSFMPYFLEGFSGEPFNFNFRINADMSIEVTNSLFRYPVYTTEFYSVDNILNRVMPYAADDLRQYLNYYNMSLSVKAEIPELYSRFDPDELTKIMPDVRFFSERTFYAMGNRAFDRLNDEGTFYEYSAPGAEYQDYIEMPEYHGYIYVPYKYQTKDMTDILNARLGAYFYIAGFLNLAFSPNSDFTSDFIASEIIYNNFAGENYLGIPEDFPSEIKELAEEITKGLDSDYDKALAVEKYIAENYTYTLSPTVPDNPRGDFVYNFLFDVGEGYCTAYASAMVMMMRSLGIPSRYAEGYLVDTSKMQKDEDGFEHMTV
ncbi:MAG: hypothetical protein FWH10_06580 [Oscillospiraceae bacterium]|nr:hypothetical protein [Oscillospiraceae bacterium]